MINNNNSSSCDDDLCDPHCPDNSRTLGIIHEFRRLYEDKMRIIDNEGSGDCSLQAKICLQQDWIRDLNEQNEMLVRAVEELEQEATERVMALEDKLRQSSKYTSEVMNGYKDLTLAFQHVDAMEEDLGTLVDFIKRSFQLRMWNLHDLKQLRTVRIDDMEKFINGGSVSGSPPSSCLTSYYDQQVNCAYVSSHLFSTTLYQNENFTLDSTYSFGAAAAAANGAATHGGPGAAVTSGGGGGVGSGNASDNTDKLLPPISEDVSYCRCDNPRPKLVRRKKSYCKCRKYIRHCAKLRAHMFDVPKVPA